MYPAQRQKKFIELEEEIGGSLESAKDREKFWAPYLEREVISKLIGSLPDPSMWTWTIWIGVWNAPNT